MNLAFDHIEFCCAIEEGDGLTHYQVPVNAEVQEMLKEMLSSTVARLGDLTALQEYQPSEKYAPGEFARVAYDDGLSAHSRTLFEANNITVNSGVLDSIEDLDFYYARFFVDNEVEAVGVKRGSQFKVLQGKRLVFFSDSLRPLGSNVFKLDDQFDYIIAKPNILVANVFGFVQTAEIDEVIQAEAVASATTMFEPVAFLDAPALAAVAETKKSAARYFASIKRRGGLENLQRPLVESHCGKFGIELIEEDGKLRPAPGAELKFLKLLDYRYLETNLTGEEQLFEATSRAPFTGGAE